MIYNQEHSFLVVESSCLAPVGFFEKKMTISKKSLCNYFCFWQKAITSFLNKNYQSFDALVGDNACHIRTCALINISNLDENFYSTLDEIILSLKHIINSLQDILFTEEDKNLSIKDFLIKKELMFLIPRQFNEQIKYIIDSYLLTLTKETLPTAGLTLLEKTNYQPVRDWEFAYNRAQFLVHHTQKSLSAQSCAYVIREASHLQNKALNKLLQIKKDTHGRSFLPQYFAAKTLFLRSLAQNQSFLIKINRYFKNSFYDCDFIWFKTNKNKSDFELSTIPCINTPIIVLSGVVKYHDLPESIRDYQTRLLSHSMLDIILANFAIHPQYSGDLKQLPPPFEDVIDELIVKNESTKVKLNSFSINNEVTGVLAEKEFFEKSKKFAIEYGCSLENPSLLFFNHMYCDLANHYNTLSNDSFLTSNKFLQNKRANLQVSFERQN